MKASYKLAATRGARTAGEEAMTEPATTLAAAPPAQQPAPARGPRGWFRRPWRLVVAGGLLVLSGLALAWGGAFLWAWYHFAEGKRCLAQYHNAEAIGHLRTC